MTKKHSTKRSLIASILVLCLCLTSFIGTTFAWFTDSVTSANNIIKSGTLDVEMYWADGKGVVEGASWTDASEGSIFNNKLWEPGYTDAKHILIANEGTLALKYELAIIPNSEVTKLADVIDVYYYADAKQITDRSDLDESMKIGTLAELISTGIRTGSLAANASHSFTLVLKMQESAGNEYQDMAVSDGFAIRLLATQFTAEEDSFDEFYDENAWVDGLRVETADALKAALYNGGNVKMGADITVNDPILIPEGVTATLDLNGFNLSSDDSSTYAISNLGNLTIIDSRATSTYSLRSASVGASITARGIYNGYCDGKIVPEAKLTIINGTFNATGTNGGAAVFNYGIAEIKGGNFTSIGGYSLNNQSGASMTVSAGVTANNGIYNTGATLVIDGGEISGNRSGCHVIYAWNSSVTINGGNFYNNNSGNATLMVAGTSTAVINDGTFGIKDGRVPGNGNTWTSCLTDTANSATLTVNGGTLNGGVRVQAGTTMNINGGNFNDVGGSNYNIYGTVAIYGGEYTDSTAIAFANKYLADKENNTLVSTDNGAATVVSAKLTPVKDANGNDIDGYYVDSNKEDIYYIANDNGLLAFAAEVNKYSNYEFPFKDKTVVLVNDIDLDGIEWTPIGDYRFSANRFCGTFDGAGHTISNYKITKTTDKNDSKKSSYGFFGNVEGTVKNLTVADAYVCTYAYVGALIGRLTSGTVENCHVESSYVECTYWQAGGMIGQVNASSTVKNCSISNSTVTGASGIGGMFGPVSSESTAVTLLFENCTVENCAIVQKGSFGATFDKYFGSMFGYLEATNDSVGYINECKAINTTVKGEEGRLANDVDGEFYFDGALAVVSFSEFKAAINAGKKVILAANIEMSESLSLANKNTYIDGNGYTITMAENATNAYALFDITGGAFTLKNVTFDGIKGGAIVRTVDAEFVADNVIAKNGVHTQVQGLFRLLGKSTVTNCTFVNNTCSMVITFNYDGANKDPQVLKNCVFEDNTCNGTAVVYYVKGAGATIDGNKFVNNTVTVANTDNAATLYMGFTENNVITNNVFERNTVNAGTSKRVAGALMIGYSATITGNAFIDNTVNATNAKGNDVCASVYYTDIDLSGNYWGGEAPVANDNYYVEYTNHSVIINDYLTTYGE